MHKHARHMKVVVKFLRKASVLKDCWVYDNEMGEVPLEISLLAKLSHPNVVQVCDCYNYLPVGLFLLLLIVVWCTCSSHGYKYTCTCVVYREDGDLSCSIGRWGQPVL